MPFFSLKRAKNVMAYRSYLRSVFNDNFKVLTWLLILFIAITPNFIFIHAANAYDPSEWTIDESNYNRTSNAVEIQARKISNSAIKNSKYFVEVPVTAAATGSTVAAMIRMGLAGAAIYGIVEGVGWIIDESGVVKKPVQSTEELSQYLWTFNGAVANTAESLCRDKYPISSGYVYLKTVLTGPDDAECWVHHTARNRDTLNYRFKRILNKDYVDTTTYVPVSDTELGEEVNKSPKAPEVLPDVYNPSNPAGGDAPQKTADALDTATPQPDTPIESDTKKKPNKDTNGDGEPDVYDPSLPDAGESTVWPVACQWFPAACDFFNVQKKDNKEIKENQKEQIAQDKTFFDRVKEWFNWTKELPDEDIGEVTIHEDTNIIFDDSQRVNFSSSCPSPEQFTVSFFGTSQNLEFSYQPLCNFMSMIKPFVVAGSYLIGAYIVMGLSRGNGD